MLNGSRCLRNRTYNQVYTGRFATLSSAAGHAGLRRAPAPSISFEPPAATLHISSFGAIQSTSICIYACLRIPRRRLPSHVITASVNAHDSQFGIILPVIRNMRGIVSLFVQKICTSTCEGNSGALATAYLSQSSIRKLRIGYLSDAASSTFLHPVHCFASSSSFGSSEQRKGWLLPWPSTPLVDGQELFERSRCRSGLIGSAYHAPSLTSQVSKLSGCSGSCNLAKPIVAIAMWALW